MQAIPSPVRVLVNVLSENEPRRTPRKTANSSNVTSHPGLSSVNETSVRLYKGEQTHSIYHFDQVFSDYKMLITEAMGPMVKGCHEGRSSSFISFGESTMTKAQTAQIFAHDLFQSLQQDERLGLSVFEVSQGSTVSDILSEGNIAQPSEVQMNSASELTMVLKGLDTKQKKKTAPMFVLFHVHKNDNTVSYLNLALLGAVKFDDPVFTSLETVLSHLTGKVSGKAASQENFDKALPSYLPKEVLSKNAIIAVAPKVSSLSLKFEANLDSLLFASSAYTGSRSHSARDEVPVKKSKMARTPVQKASMDPPAPIENKTTVARTPVAAKTAAKPLRRSTRKSVKKSAQKPKKPVSPAKPSLMDSVDINMSMVDAFAPKRVMQRTPLQTAAAVVETPKAMKATEPAMQLDDSVSAFTTGNGLARTPVGQVSAPVEVVKSVETPKQQQIVASQKVLETSFEAPAPAETNVVAPVIEEKFVVPAVPEKNNTSMEVVSEDEVQSIPVVEAKRVVATPMMRSMKDRKSIVPYPDTPQSPFMSPINRSFFKSFNSVQTGEIYVCPATPPLLTDIVEEDSMEVLSNVEQEVQLPNDISVIKPVVEEAEPIVNEIPQPVAEEIVDEQEDIKQSNVSVVNEETVELTKNVALELEQERQKWRAAFSAKASEKENQPEAVVGEKRKIDNIETKAVTSVESVSNKRMCTSLDESSGASILRTEDPFETIGLIGRSPVPTFDDNVAPQKLDESTASLKADPFETKVRIGRSPVPLFNEKKETTPAKKVAVFPSPVVNIRNPQQTPPRRATPVEVLSPFITLRSPAREARMHQTHVVEKKTQIVQPVAKQNVTRPGISIFKKPTPVKVSSATSMSSPKMQIVARTGVDMGTQLLSPMLRVPIKKKATIIVKEASCGSDDMIPPMPMGMEPVQEEEQVAVVEEEVKSPSPIAITESKDQEMDIVTEADVSVDSAEMNDQSVEQQPENVPAENIEQADIVKQKPAIPEVTLEGGVEEVRIGEVTLTAAQVRKLLMRLTDIESDNRDLNEAMDIANANAEKFKNQMGETKAAYENQAKEHQYELDKAVRQQKDALAKMKFEYATKKTQLELTELASSSSEVDHVASYKAASEDVFLQKRVDTLLMETQLLKSQKEDMLSKFSSLLEQAHASAAVHKKNLTIAQEYMNTLTLKNAELTENIEQLTMENETQRQNMISLEQKYAAEIKKVKNLSIDQAKTERELHALRKENTAFEKEVAAQKREVKKTTKALAKNESQIDNLKSSLTSFKSTNAKLTKEAAQLKKSVAKKEAEVVVEKKSPKKKKTSLKKALKNIDAVIEAVEDSDSDYQEEKPVKRKVSKKKKKKRSNVMFNLEDNEYATADENTGAVTILKKQKTSKNSTKVTATSKPKAVAPKPKVVVQQPIVKSNDQENADDDAVPSNVWNIQSKPANKSGKKKLFSKNVGMSAADAMLVKPATPLQKPKMKSIAFSGDAINPKKPFLKQFMGFGNKMMIPKLKK